MLKKVSKNLGELSKGVRAIITHVKCADPEQHRIALRMMALGFTPGAFVQIIFESPFSANAIAVEIRGMVIAMRREEAAWVEVSCVL